MRRIDHKVNTQEVQHTILTEKSILTQLMTHDWSQIWCHDKDLLEMNSWNFKNQNCSHHNKI